MLVELELGLGLGPGLCLGLGLGIWRVERSEEVMLLRKWHYDVESDNPGLYGDNGCFQAPMTSRGVKIQSPGVIVFQYSLPFLYGQEVLNVGLSISRVKCA